MGTIPGIMKVMGAWWRVDPAAIVAALVACSVAVGYVWLIRQENDQAAAWFLGGLVVSILLCVYGSARVPMRRSALAVAGGIMTVLGTLGILSIGLPVLVAGIVALIAAARPGAARSRTEVDR